MILKHLPSFNVAFSRLSKADSSHVPVVIEFCHKFKEAASVEAGHGLHIHRVEPAKSPDVWSARASHELRVILRKRGPSWYAAYVGHHDAAYKWAEKTEVVLPKTTAPEGDAGDDIDLALVALPVDNEAAHSGDATRPGERPVGIFDAFDDNALEDLGVPHVMVPMLRQLASIDEYIERAYGSLPEAAGDRLFAALDGDFATVAEGLAEVAEVGEGDAATVIRTPEITDAIDILAAHPQSTWAALPDAQQLQIAEGKFSGPVLVTGPAGSGKTAVALHRARYLAKQGKHVLLTTYTKSLQRFLAEEMDVLCSGAHRARVDVATLDHVAIELSDYQDSLFDKEFLSREDFQRTCVEATQRVAKGKAKVSYDAVVVDEAQDLDPVRVAFIQALSRACRKNVMLLGDMRQRIYSEPFDLEDLGFDFDGRVFELDTVYRSTRQIAALGEAIMSTAEADDYIAADGACRLYAGGPPPRFVCHGSDIAELCWLAAAVVEEVGRGRDAHGIGVLARTNQRVSEMRAILAAVGLSQHRGIRVSTMHGAKGLEFGQVFIVSVGADRIPNPYAAEHKRKDGTYGLWHEHERNLLHVAATRASERVTMSWVGEPSPFLAKALASAVVQEGPQSLSGLEVSLNVSRFAEDPAGLRQAVQSDVVNAETLAELLRPYAEKIIREGRLK